MEQNSLTKLTQAARMLSEAVTIQAAKELKDLALTAMDWAKRKGLGEEAVQYARGYALEAERKMGAMLAQTERAKGGQPYQSTGNTMLPVEPTLAELGLTKRESSEAQMLAALPDETFEMVKAGETTIAEVKKQGNLEIKKSRVISETRELIKLPAVIIESDCMSILDSIDDIDLLIADPPYFTDGDFTRQVSECLSRVKGTGQAYVFAGADPSEVAAYIAMESHHMELIQILIWNYNNTGQRQPLERYNSNYQVCFYYRGPQAGSINKPADGKEQYACQTINAPDGRQGDRYHSWQKPIELIERLIRNSSSEGDFIFDPFAGTGTTMLAASKLGRKSIGCDIDNESVKICIQRGCTNGI